jgi:hypothetical protein
MVNRRNTPQLGKMGGWVRRRAAMTALAATFCLVLAAGCNSTSNTKAKQDPLVGDIHPPANPNNPFAPQPPANAHQNGVPPVPTTQGPVTNAALASIAGSRPLAIGDATQAGLRTAQPAGYVAPASTGRPRVVALPRDPAAPPVLNTGSVAANQATTDVLQAQLRARGVLFQKVDAVPEGGIKFSCLVPSPSNPESHQFYEAIAADYPSAVQAVIVQIDRQK